MREQLEIVVAGRDEWREALSVTLRAYGEYEEKSDPNFWKGYKQSIENALLKDESDIRIVVKENGMILAAVLYCAPYEKQMGDAFVKNPFPEMRLLAVPEEHRNRGLAGQLIEYCEAKARAEGSPTITLHTTVLMQTAKQMYERRNYLRYPEIDFEPIPGFVVWGYRKDL